MDPEGLCIQSHLALLEYNLSLFIPIQTFAASSILGWPGVELYTQYHHQSNDASPCADEWSQQAASCKS